MRKNKKTWLALAALLILVFAMSSTASAASPKTVAKIGSKKYTSLQKAMKSVKKGQTIKLTKNVTLTSFDQLTFNRNVKYTLDLNKHTIKHKDAGYSYFFMEKGTVTIKNGTISTTEMYIKGNVKATFQKVKLVAPKPFSSSRINLFSNASLVLQKCNMSSTRIEAAHDAKSKSKITISGGSYQSVWNYGKGTVTMNSGTIQQINNEATGKTIINNATINYNSPTLGCPICVSKGTMVINNVSCTAIQSCLTVDSGATLTVKNGKFTTTTTRGGTPLNNSGTTYLNGGTFTRNNTNDFFKNEGINNCRGKLTLGSGVKLVNCAVKEYN